MGIWLWRLLRVHIAAFLDSVRRFCPQASLSQSMWLLQSRYADTLPATESGMRLLCACKGTDLGAPWAASNLLLFQPSTSTRHCSTYGK